MGAVGMLAFYDAGEVGSDTASTRNARLEGLSEHSRFSARRSGGVPRRSWRL